MTPPARNTCAFILWGAYFNEVMAMLFATALRTAGWQTKLVGLQGHTHTGRHGLTMVADLSLSQALHNVVYVACVVAPCRPEVLLAATDPRIEDFLIQARRQHAVLVAEYSGASIPDTRWPRDAQVVMDGVEQISDAAKALIETLDNSH